jgi:hypothetical protein
VRDGKHFYGSVGAFYIDCIHVFYHFNTLAELLALGGRRSEALPFVRVNVRLSLAFAP